MCLFVYLSVRLSFCPSVRPRFPVCLSVCLSVCLKLSLFQTMPACQLVCLSVCLSVSSCLSVLGCAYLSACLSVCLSVCQSVYVLSCPVLSTFDLFWSILLLLLCRACSDTVNYCLPPLSVSHEPWEFTSLGARISCQNVDIAFRWSALGSSSVSWLPQGP